MFQIIHYNVAVCTKQDVSCVKLESWPSQQFKMDMKVNRLSVNLIFAYKRPQKSKHMIMTLLHLRMKKAHYYTFKQFQGGWSFIAQDKAVLSTEKYSYFSP